MPLPYTIPDRTPVPAQDLEADDDDLDVTSSHAAAKVKTAVLSRIHPNRLHKPKKKAEDDEESPNSGNESAER